MLKIVAPRLAALRKQIAETRITPELVGSLWLLLLFVLVVCAHILLMRQRWEQPLLDQFPFRQTQTALAARSIAEGGPLLAYELPVLGKPWSLPFEFPVYQWLVAALSQAGLALEQSGRWISVLAFYATLWPLLSILRRIGVPRWHRVVPLTLFVASPLYLFWSHAFMIESLALFLAVLYIAISLRYLAQPTRRTVLLVLLVGIVAALTKITTFVVATVPVLLLAFAVMLRKEQRDRQWKQTVAITVVTVIAVLAAVGWNAYADALKTANPLAAEFLTSDALRAWNFGKWEQKLSLPLWAFMFERSLPEITGGPDIGGIGVLILIGAVSVFSARYRVPALFALAAFVTGPLVFTNLYVVHNYYFCANGIYLLAFCAFGVLTLLDASEGISQITRWILWPAVVTLLFVWYWQTTYTIANEQYVENIFQVAAVIDQNTAPDDVIVIYGHDWMPVIPYYAHRRALMDRWEMPVNDPKLRRALQELQGERIGGMLIGGPLSRNETFVRERARAFGLNPEPIARVTMGDFYVRNKRP